MILIHTLRATIVPKILEWIYDHLCILYLRDKYDPLTLISKGWRAYFKMSSHRSPSISSHDFINFIIILIYLIKHSNSNLMFLMIIGNDINIKYETLWNFISFLTYKSYSNLSFILIIYKSEHKLSKSSHFYLSKINDKRPWEKMTKSTAGFHIYQF